MRNKWHTLYNTILKGQQGTVAPLISPKKKKSEETEATNNVTTDVVNSNPQTVVNVNVDSQEKEPNNIENVLEGKYQDNYPKVDQETMAQLNEDSSEKGQELKHSEINIQSTNPDNKTAVNTTTSDISDPIKSVKTYQMPDIYTESTRVLAEQNPENNGMGTEVKLDDTVDMAHYQSDYQQRELGKVLGKAKEGFSNVDWSMASKTIQLGSAALTPIGQNANQTQTIENIDNGWNTATEMATAIDPKLGAAFATVGLTNKVMGAFNLNPTNEKARINKAGLAKVGSSAQGTNKLASGAEAKSGQTTGFLGIQWGGNDNNLIDEAGRQSQRVGNIASKNEDLRLGAAATTQQNYEKTRQLLSGNNINFNKDGGTIEENPVSFFDWKNQKQNIISFNDWKVKKHQQGGILESPNNIESDQQNIIPEGALHKNKHNLNSTTGLDDSQYTKKGIPVLDDEGNQQAEIELNEIIFNLEVTKFLEENCNKYFESNTKHSEKENIAFKVGEELIYQILQNTQDNTGLIQVAKNGGILNTN